MKKDMRWKVAQIGMLTTMLAMESILPQGHIVDARHQTAQYRIEEDMELAGLSSYVRGGQAEGAYVSETIARVHDQWQQKKQEEKQKQRIRQQKLEQERMRKERQKRKQEQRKRARRARIRRAKQKQKRDEKNRRLAIEEKCGRVIGTESERILQRIVEAEAGGEDLEGRALVANVILNRVLGKQFPSTIKEVVFAHSGSRYQFSPVSNGSYYSVHVSSGTKKAVRRALQGQDTSQGALYFMERALADSGNASWFDRCLTKVKRHGCHEFYKYHSKWGSEYRL